MSDTPQNLDVPKSIKEKWRGSKAEASRVPTDDIRCTKTAKPSLPSFFQPEDFDIYVNKLNNEAYIFHGPPLPAPVERLEYNPYTHRVRVFTKNGPIYDLGVELQWLVRTYFKRAKEVFIVQTKDGEMLTGEVVPMTEVQS